MTLERRAPLKVDRDRLISWQRRSRKPLPRVSKRTAGNDIPAWSRKAVERRADGRCEARLDGCSGRHDHTHHIVRRRHRRHDPDVLLACCWSCHSAIHRHVALSRAFGFLADAPPVAQPLHDKRGAA